MCADTFWCSQRPGTTISFFPLHTGTLHRYHTVEIRAPWDCSDDFSIVLFNAHSMSEHPKTAKKNKMLKKNINGYDQNIGETLNRLQSEYIPFKIRYPPLHLPLSSAILATNLIARELNSRSGVIRNTICLLCDNETSSGHFNWWNLPNLPPPDTWDN